MSRRFYPSNLHRLIHTLSHRRQRQPCKATASSSGAVRVKCLAQGHINTRWWIKLANFRLLDNCSTSWAEPSRKITHLFQQIKPSFVICGKKVIQLVGRIPSSVKTSTTCQHYCPLTDHLKRNPDSMLTSCMLCGAASVIVLMHASQFELGPVHTGIWYWPHLKHDLNSKTKQNQISKSKFMNKGTKPTLLHSIPICARFYKGEWGKQIDKPIDRIYNRRIYLTIQLLKQMSIVLMKLIIFFWVEWRHWGFKDAIGPAQCQLRKKSIGRFTCFMGWSDMIIISLKTDPKSMSATQENDCLNLKSIPSK